MITINTIVVSTFRRPFQTRLCLESLCRAQRWHHWAHSIYVCLASNGHVGVLAEVKGVVARNPDIPIVILHEPPDASATPHTASKWMLDFAFSGGAEVVLYVEDDVIVSPDAFALIHFIDQIRITPSIAGVCLYHETIPEHYIPNPPDPTKLHLCNGLNTCGGTAFFRQPYLQTLGPSWNCKTVEPLGFDYSAHYLLYLHKLYMVYPDLSRSMNIGWRDGSLSQEQWAKYCGRSIWAQTDDALDDWTRFKLNGVFPAPVREEWMIPELRAKGILI